MTELKRNFTEYKLAAQRLLDSLQKRDEVPSTEYLADVIDSVRALESQPVPRLSQTSITIKQNLNLIASAENISFPWANGSKSDRSGLSAVVLSG